MKRTILHLAGVILLITLGMSCSKTESGTSQSALKDAVTAGTQNLNNAISDIATTQAFQLLGIDNSSSLKSATIYTANIPLDLVKGVYDYKALKTAESRNYPLSRFFTKSADASKMVVNMPLAKLKNPRDLRNYLAADSTLTNNFSIAVTDYYNNYNSYRDYDYIHTAAITIDKLLAGNLSIKSIVNPTTGKAYSSQFTFSNGYTAKYQYASGDTTRSGFTLLKNTSVLYKEELQTVRNDTARFGRESQYTLTIGDVKLVRKADKTYEVYLKNVLQTKAVVAMVDQVSTTEPSVCHHREIQITFEDGTVSTISTLISKSIDNLSTLFTSLHEVYFAAYVVDWIAYDIYYKR
jgi:hypothetical protein